MSRLVYIFSRKAQDPSEKPADAAEENLLSTMTCTAKAANFLGITDKQYSGSVPRERKAYAKQILDAAGAEKLVQVPAGQITFMPSSRAGAKTVFLKTGMKSTVKKNHRTLSLTFGSSVTVGQIAEFLAEIIPATKIQRTSTAPSATEIFPQFSLKGGRTYPIGLEPQAEESVEVNVPETPAEQAAVVAQAK